MIGFARGAVSRNFTTGYGSAGKVVDSLKNTIKDVGMGRSLRHGVEGMSPKASQLVQEEAGNRESNYKDKDQTDESSPGLESGKAKMSNNPNQPAGIFEKISSAIHEAEEGVVHTVQGVAEGLKHGTTQILQGGREELEDFAKGVRESSEALPTKKHGAGAMSRASRNVGRVAEQAREAVEKHGHPPQPSQLGEYNRLAGVVETGQGDVLSPEDFAASEPARTLGNIANDEARSAWAQSHVYGEKARQQGEKMVHPITEKLESIKVEESPLERLTHPISERLQEAVEKIKEGVESIRHGTSSTIESAKETVSSTAESTVGRGKELAGGVAKEVGHAAGAAKAMDPDQLLTPTTGTSPKGSTLAESVQREYEAGQQEQMINEAVASDSVPRNFTEEVESVAGKVKEQTQGVAEGVAHQYGKASEALKKKVDEGAAEVRH